MVREERWIAKWAIKQIPEGRCEVIRDGRHVGIARCDDLEEAIQRILDHRNYQSGDRVVHWWNGEEWELDVERHAPALAGSRD